MWITRLVLMCAAFIIAMPQAKAAVLYDNGPADPTKQIWRIHDRFGYDLAIADSFTLTEDAVLTGVELTLYVYHDITPISLDWAITSTPNTYPIQATAHLALTNIDTVTEELLQEILNKLPKTTTRVIIAHRLNTISNVDQIFFVNSGDILLAGSMEHAVDMLLHEKRAS